MSSRRPPTWRTIPAPRGSGASGRAPASLPCPSGSSASSRPQACWSGPEAGMAGSYTSRARRGVKVALWLGGIAIAVAVLDLLGVDVLGWLSDLWDELTTIPPGYLVAGWSLQAIQTTLTAL